MATQRARESEKNIDIARLTAENTRLTMDNTKLTDKLDKLAADYAALTHKHNAQGKLCSSIKADSKHVREDYLRLRSIEQVSGCCDSGCSCVALLDAVTPHDAPQMHPEHIRLHRRWGRCNRALLHV
jgi:hypothetical protein